MCLTENASGLYAMLRSIFAMHVLSRLLSRGSATGFSPVRKTLKSLGRAFSISEKILLLSTSRIFHTAVCAKTKSGEENCGSLFLCTANMLILTINCRFEKVFFWKTIS